MVLASIVTVVYNNRDQLAEFFKHYSSVAHRSDIELVVIDGGSTDGTVELIQSRSDIVDKYVSEADEGIYDAMNKGIGLARGAYISLINSDDFIIPDNFAAALDALASSEADIFAGGAKMVRNGQPGFNRWPRHLDTSLYVRTIPFSHNAIFVSRALYDRIGLYRKDLRIVSDLEFYYRAAEAGAKVELFNRLIIRSELTGVSGRETGRLGDENISILHERLPFLDRRQIETLVEFRAALANSDGGFNLRRLFRPLERAAQNGVDLAAMCKIAIDAMPMNLMGERFDYLLHRLPRMSGKTPHPASRLPVPLDETLLTVGIPVYNCEDTIEHTLRSILSQTWPNIEIVVYDDFSTDRTLDVVRSVVSDQIRIFRSPCNRGVAATRNAIATEARGKYLMFCDDDDVSHPGRAAACMEKVAEVGRQTGRPDDVVCFTTRELVTLSGNRFEVTAAGSKAPLRGREIRQVVLANLARVAGRTGWLEDLDIAEPRAVGTGVGLYPTALIREIGFHESFRRLEDLEFCMAAADRIVVCGVREPLYTQFMTAAADKGNDQTAAFSALLLRLYHDSFVEAGLDPDDLAGDYAEMAKPPLRNRLFEMIRVPSFKAGMPSVVTLCTWDRGGAALGSRRRVEALRARGVDNTLYCLFKTTKKPYIRYFPMSEQPEAKETVNDLWKRKALVPADGGGLGHKGQELFSTTEGLVDFRETLPYLTASDIVHLHWVVGMFDYEHTEELANTPVAWTLADMNAFTGGCHYSEGCEGYKDACRECPLLAPGSTLAHEAWKKKRDAYAKIKNLHVICPSQWLADCAKDSALFGDRPVHMIPNAFPVDRFTPTNKVVARQKLGLPLTKKLVVFGADSLNNRRKGGDILAASIRHLRDMGQAEDVEGVFFGAASLDLGIPGHNMGHVSDEVKLSLIYAAADVFAFPSREDNAPLTVVESLLSGTPVVAFPVGNVPEMIQHKDTGFIASYEDAKDFAEGLVWALNGQDHDELRMRGLRGHLHARAHNDPEIAAACHIALYTRMLEQSRSLDQAEEKREANVVNIPQVSQKSA